MVEEPIWGRHDYRIFSIFGSPVCAAPRAFGISAIKNYHTFTIKRSIAAFCLRSLNALYLQRIISAPFDGKDPYNADIDIKVCTACVSECLSVVNLQFAFYFQKQKDRGRIYVAAIENNEVIAFSKASFNTHKAIKIEAEKAAVEHISSGAFGFRVPRTLGSFSDAHFSMLISEAISDFSHAKNVKIAELQKVAGELRKSHCMIATSHIFNSTWWKDYIRDLDDDGKNFHKQLQELLSVSDITMIGFAHGDLGFHNAVKANGEVWVYDWEDSSSVAPTLTDTLALYLASERNIHKAFNAETFLAWHSKVFHESKSLAKLEAMLAIAYRSTIAKRDAKVIISLWR